MLNNKVELLICLNFLMFAILIPKYTIYEIH